MSETKAGFSDSLETNKASVRNRLRTIRGSIPPDEYQTFSAQICDRLLSYRHWRPEETIHVFWPVLKRNEPDIRPFIFHLHGLGARVTLPVVVSFSQNRDGGKRLRQAEYKSRESLSENKWGIAEPKYDSFVSPGQLDFAIVPALGAGRDGYRIGYGMGYYDEFLSDLSVPTLCPVFSTCLLEEIPHEIHDIPVATIITDRETIETGGT